MNEDISNRTLAALLAITIVVSLGGTFFVLNNPVSISGFATNQNNDTGTVTFDLTEQINIYLSDDTIFMNNTLYSGVRTLSSVAGAGVGQNANLDGTFVLHNNGTNSSDINVYLDASLNNEIWNVAANPNVCTSATNGSTDVNCNNAIGHALNNSQVYVVSDAAATAYCNSFRGNSSSEAVSLGNFTYGTQSSLVLCDEMSAQVNNQINLGVALTVPVGQEAFGTKTFDVYFLATND